MATFISISFIETAALVYGEKHFPAKTPRRWHLIAEYVLRNVSNFSKETTEAHFCLGQQGSTSTLPFESTAEICKSTFSIISNYHQELLQYTKHQTEILFSDPSLSAFKPLILLPSILRCCERPVYLRYIPSYAYIIYYYYSYIFIWYIITSINLRCRYSTRQHGINYYIIL